VDPVSAGHSRARATSRIDVPPSDYRNKLKWHEAARKHHNTNPKRGGPFHYRSPSQIFWRCVRGMLPHKTERGAAALTRLKVFEGIPAPYDKIKRMVVPGALTVSKLKPGRDVCNLGLLAHEIGWKHLELLKRLEAKRKLASGAYYAKKKDAVKRLSAARKSVKA
jgi:large subunit ribosomal protein L13Ae